MTDWTKKTKKRSVSTKTAIACGLIPDIANGSLWRLKGGHVNTSLGRNFLMGKLDQESGALFRKGNIVMVYNVEYHKLKPIVPMAPEVWNITFSFLIGEKLVEDCSLWHDEWGDIFEEASNE